MVGPLKKASGGFTHLLMVVDKFTKWIEAKPITNIYSEEAVKFFLDIIYRFGVPNCIITDHRTNFTGKKFPDFYDGYGIRIDWALVRHPRTNGQVERADRLILKGIKTCIYNELKIHAGRWVDELPSLLWNLRASVNRSIGYTSFFLVYGAEVVIPSNLDFDAPHICFYNEQQTEEQH